MAPNLLTLLWRDWQPALAVDVPAALAVAAYLAGAARVPRWPAWRTAGFLAGIAAVLVALQSGIGAWDDRLLSDHMIQHLLLLEVAPLLLLSGRPVVLALRGGPRARRAALARRARRLAPLTHPLLCLAIFYAVVLGTHLAAFYDATLTDPALHETEHAVYLGAGLLMWWPMLDGDPDVTHRLSGFARLAYLVAAMAPMTLIGAYVYRHASLVYGGYEAPAHALGISALTDQALGGTIMWMVGGTLMVVVGMWQAMAALVDEERRMQIRERAAVAGPADPGAPR